MTSKSPQDANFDLEQQFLLRLPEEAARYLSEDLNVGISLKDNLTIEMKPDMRHSIVRYNGQVYQGRLMDLPCIIESLKTTDRNTFYKTADISQIMICSQNDESGPIHGSAAFHSVRSAASPFGMREYQYLHGITPSLKNVLRRRFRKTRKKRSVDMPQIENEVKRLLKTDLQAEGVKWEVIWSDLPETVRSSVSNSGAPSGLSHEETVTVGSVKRENGDAANLLQYIEEEDEDAPGSPAVDHFAVFGDISSSIDSCVSTSCSEDEELSKSCKPIEIKVTNSPDTTEYGEINEANILSSENMFSSLHDSLPNVKFEELKKSQASPLGIKLKDELAAELLLSDTDDADDATSSDASSYADRGSRDSFPEYPIVSVPQDSVFSTIEDTHAAAGIVLDDVTGIVSDDAIVDEEEEFQSGGELLDDLEYPFGTIFRDPDNIQHSDAENHFDDGEIA